MAILTGSGTGLATVFMVCLSLFPLRGCQGQAMNWVPSYGAEETCTRICARV